MSATKEHISKYIVSAMHCGKGVQCKIKVMYNVACDHNKSEMFSRLHSEDKVYLYAHITLFLKHNLLVSGQPEHSVGNVVKSPQALATSVVSLSPKSTFVEFLMRCEWPDNCSRVR